MLGPIVKMYGLNGSVVFQVYVDGEKQFDSGLMNSRDPQQYVEVNLAGAKELKLVVTDGGKMVIYQTMQHGEIQTSFLLIVNGRNEPIIDTLL